MACARVKHTDLPFILFTSDLHTLYIIIQSLKEIEEKRHVAQIQQIWSN